MGIRYIGSKSRIVDEILDFAGPPVGDARFVDAFCGTGAVAQAASVRGWPVLVNDFMKSSVVLSTAGLVSKSQASFSELGGYNRVVEKLNSLSGRKGFIHREYSPASSSSGAPERRYFTEVNAKKIDAIRYQIEKWYLAGLLSQNEYYVLLADLILSSNAVANISGTYGCFLSQWTESSKKQLEVKPRSFPTRTKPFQWIVGDVFDLQVNREDVVYLDPPYTKRQYASYYHILETIVIGDEPIVEGVCGLRPWRDRASDFCYKRKALPALLRLINQLDASRILLSYSNEGHVSQTALLEGLREIGEVSVHDLERIGRYRPNAAASAAASDVNEFLIEILPARTAVESSLLPTGS